MDNDFRHSCEPADWRCYSGDHRALRVGNKPTRSGLRRCKFGVVLVTLTPFALLKRRAASLGAGKSSTRSGPHDLD